MLQTGFIWNIFASAFETLQLKKKKEKEVCLFNLGRKSFPDFFCWFFFSSSVEAEPANQISSRLFFVSDLSLDSDQLVLRLFWRQLQVFSPLSSMSEIFFKLIQSRSIGKRDHTFIPVPRSFQSRWFLDNRSPFSVLNDPDTYLWSLMAMSSQWL